MDKNGKGSTRDSEAVAKAMVAQGAWRRMFNEFRTNKRLASLLTAIFEADPGSRASLVDELYTFNEGRRNHLTGPSGNAICAFLAAYDPKRNLSIISLKDRRLLAEFLQVDVPFEWETESVGKKIVVSNTLLLEKLRELEVGESARSMSEFCYFAPMKILWKGGNTVKRADKDIPVTVPERVEDSDARGYERQSLEGMDEVRESMQIQALLAKIGASMGFYIWLPKADRGRVLKVWDPGRDVLLDRLPLGYDATTMKTIEQIDVIWLKRNSIARAFEVEHTTSVYSGLLRMADLIALQPNIDIALHIVAPELKRDKVFQEIMRPVFSLLEGHALHEMCTFLSYDSVKEIADLKHLEYLSENVIDDYEERAEEDV